MATQQINAVLFPRDMVATAVCVAFVGFTWAESTERGLTITGNVCSSLTHVTFVLMFYINVAAALRHAK